jgi:glyoxylase-like metal-dependent hydrolase (beta-lactamase superfamily II)
MNTRPPPRPASADELALEYPLGDTLPAAGRVIELRPGVRWLRMGLPFALDHINLWLLADELGGQRGWTVVDCGIDDAATRANWEQIFANALDDLPVLRVVVTHMHPDHIGLAHWLCARFGSTAGASPAAHDCRLWISATDWHVARLASQSSVGQGGAEAADFFASHGLVDPASLDKVRARRGYYASLVPAVPPQYARLHEGLVLRVDGRPWRCIAGYGHAPEHIALFREDDGLLISGDMVLPRISTNVSVYEAEPEANPLPMFLASIERLRALPEGTLVLPSHGRPFRGLHARIGQLQRHHDERLAEVLQACAEAPRSAAGLLPLLFKRPLDLHQTTFAMGEAVAHLHALSGQNLVRRTRGVDGVWRFGPA